MTIKAITVTEPKKNNHSVILPATMGALAGAAARYIVPTKAELTKMLNKESVDSFVSSAKISARSANRSILKYGAIGAMIAGLGALITKALTSQKQNHTLDYSKYGAVIDSSIDSAYAMIWYEDNIE